ncbi:MAG: bifunctional DNA-formamidopyrimidine glycosylase/DNA-(apurinic or apyrimidinic site) lyase, partial [Actinobacteria bacterium]|nr:bifunctional DNA-formamidopyrimidine glycosylase/DNA-(apurinic or apyrimidinic site) lyase [Actinomycetota bacterium]
RHLSGPADFRKKLVGTKVLDVVRRGKFLWLPLDSGVSALVGHLGMSGQMLIRTPDYPADNLNRVTIEFETSKGKPLELRFVDQRIFGSLAIDDLVQTRDGGSGGFSAGKNRSKPWQNLIPVSAAHIARDPLDDAFDQDAVVSKMRTKKSGIKRVILDQNLVSGIGNIYADESLWLAKLHFDRSADGISKAKLTELMEISKQVLAAAVKQGGTSFDEQYKNVNGESGYFSQQLYAYGQTDRPCARCQTPIRRQAWANRGSHFCPRCQRPS